MKNKPKRIYKKGVPFDIYPVMKNKDCVGTCEVIVIKSLNGAVRAIDRGFISESDILDGFFQQEHIKAQMKARQQHYLKTHNGLTPYQNFLKNMAEHIIEEEKRKEEDTEEEYDEGLEDEDLEY